MAARSGIIPGFGRRPLGRGPPGPAAPGRGPPGPAAPGRDWGRGIPWLGANGLLPGRGDPSRALGARPMPWLGAKGLLPGLGWPGRGVERAGSAVWTRAAIGRGRTRSGGGAGLRRCLWGSRGSGGGRPGRCRLGRCARRGGRSGGRRHRRRLARRAGGCRCGGRRRRLRRGGARRSCRCGLGCRRGLGCRCGLGCGWGLGCRCGSRRDTVGNDWCGLGGRSARPGLSDLAYDRGLDGRGCRPHELALLLQVGQQRLALHPELLGELVYPDLGHASPSPWSGLAKAAAFAHGPLVGLAHR